MILRQLPALLVAAASIAVAFPVHAQVFRWIDSGGVVNYGSKAPRGATAVVRVDGDASRLSVVHGAARSAVGSENVATTTTTVTPRAALPGNTVDRSTVDTSARTLELRERCFAERRVDCTGPTAATYDFAPSYTSVLR